MSRTWIWRLPLAALFGIVISAPAWAGLTVELRDTVYVPGGYVRLCEVATIRGDRDLRGQAGRMYLGPAPDRGCMRRFTREEIRARLQETGILGPVRFAGALRVSVHTREEEAPAGRADGAVKAPPQPAQLDIDALIQEALGLYLHERYARKDITLSSTCDRVEGNLPAGTHALRVAEVLTGRLPGRAGVQLQAVDADGLPLAAIKARVQLTARVPVLMVRRAVKPNEVLRKEDLMVARASLRQGVVYLPANLGRFIGKAASRSLRNGIPLQLGDLTEPLAVRKGEFVKVDTVAGGFRIQTHAVASRDARVGELLLVQNLNPKQCTKKSFPARVIGPNKVEVLQIKGR